MSHREPITDIYKDKKIFSATAADVHPKNLMPAGTVVRRGGIRL